MPPALDFQQFVDGVDTVLYGIAVGPRGQFRFEMVNEAFLKATGLKRKQIEGRLVAEVIPGPSCDVVLKHYRQAVRTRCTVRWEETSTYPTGQKHGEVTVKPFVGAGGRVTHLFGTVHDITARKRAEEALRENEKRHVAAVRGANEGLWEWNIITGATFLSPSWKRLLGFLPGELADERQEAFLDRLHPDDVTRVTAVRKAHLTRGAPYDVELRLRMKDGSYRWFLTRGQAVKNARGRYEKMSGTLTDIHERKVAEQFLREREQMLNAMFEHANVGVGTVELATKRFISANGFLCRMMGRTRSELMQLDVTAVTHPDDQGQSAEHYRQMAAGRLASFHVEKRYVRPDGSTVWGNLHASVLHDAEGRPHRLTAVVEDITARKVAEDKYLSEMLFNEVLVKHTAAIIVLLDQSGHMIYVNDATLRILGYQRRDLIGRTPWAAGIMDAAEAARSKERLSRLLRGDPNPPRQVILYGKDGRGHHVELHSTTTRTPEGRLDRIIVTGTDFTERHQLQREILKICEVEQARIGHNLHDGIGQMMTGIASLMAGLELELHGDQQQQAARISELIRQAMVEVRQMSHGLSPMAVTHRGLDGSLRLLAETIRGHHRIKCALHIDPSVRLGDVEKETHVYRIAQEAANNAVRHGRPGRVNVSLRRQGKNGVLKIEDDGEGLASARTPRLAQGIGIRVMHYRANCIDGTLDVKPRKSGGVAVVCRFPLD